MIIASPTFFGFSPTFCAVAVRPEIKRRPIGADIGGFDQVEVENFARHTAPIIEREGASFGVAEHAVPDIAGLADILKHAVFKQEVDAAAGHHAVLEDSLDRKNGDFVNRKIYVMAAGIGFQCTFEFRQENRSLRFVFSLSRDFVASSIYDPAHKIVSVVLARPGRDEL